MILVTGITSGLGKYLHNRLGCDGWKRGDSIPKKHYSNIIHCAHSKHPHENDDMLRSLFSIPCDKFTYISSLDVYNAFHLGHTGYAMTKLRCEQFVRQSYGKHLILRLGGLIGRDARPNTLTRAISGNKVTVTPDSTFGYIQHESVVGYLSGEGTVNVSGNAMVIRDILEELGIAAPEYGEFPYHTPYVQPTHDTLEEIREFIRDSIADQG